MFKIEKFDLLVSIYIFCICVSELMGGKTFPIYNNGTIHLNASVAIFLLPVIYTINDIIVEVFGKERARSVVRSGLLMVVFIFLFAALAVLLPPSVRSQAKETAYDTIFGQAIRISLASLTAFMVSEFMDIFIFSKLRERFHKKALWLRNNASNIISAFFDTAIFMILAFYAFDKPFGNNMSYLVSLIAPYWFLKSVMSIIETPMVYLGVKWLKNKD